MRYEHIELDISTATCDALKTMIERADATGEGWPKLTRDELCNLLNELRARLDRRDPDPKCPLNLDPLLA